MICKKCGANIADTAKFCGNCGDKIEQINNLNQKNVDVINSVASENSVEKNSTQPDLTQTLSQLEKQNINRGEQLNSTDQLNQTIVLPPVNAIKEQSNSNESKSKKSNTWIFVIGGIVLGLIILAIFVFILSKSFNNPVKKLEQALNQIEEKGENSGTIDAKISIITDTSDTYNLSATMKYSKRHDLYDVSLTLNKSLLYEEMNFYSTIADDYITLYSKSSSIDMLGSTSSTTDMWVYYLMKLDELQIEDIDLDNDIYLHDILDKKHYKYIDKQNGIKHYQLTIDNELLNKIKTKSGKDDLREFEQSLSEINNGQIELSDTYYINIYINNSGELVKVSMDLTEELVDENIKKLVISFEFDNFGNTSVEIPNDAKSSTMDLESYLSTYGLYQNSDVYGDEYYYDYGE